MLIRGVWGKVGSVVTLRAVQGVILVRKSGAKWAALSNSTENALYL